MPLRLILIRHAKSSWDDPFADDHARVLNERGRDTAPAIGGWLAAQGYDPDLVLCSDAARTRETAALVMQMLPSAPILRILPALYHASPDALLGLIRQQDVRCLVLIGHNPGIGALAQGLLTAPPPHPRFADYPTAATTVIDFKGTQWTSVGPQTGVCVDFVVPSDLID